MPAAEESTDVKESAPVYTMDRFELDTVFSLLAGRWETHILQKHLNEYGRSAKFLQPG